MVKRLHRAGIEVILDVVYNHTGEGDQLGPTLSLRGIDNAVVLPPRSGRPPRATSTSRAAATAQHAPSAHDRSSSWTACATGSREMHVDGFRFDLAPALARELHEVNRLGAFFDIIQQDPVLSQVKLIAEPWDLGPGGYQVGQLPASAGRSGTASTATRCAASGAATPGQLGGARLPPDRQQRPLRRAAAAARTRASTSSPRTTASRCAISSATSRSTTRRTARTTATAPTTTGAATGASEGRHRPIDVLRPARPHRRATSSRRSPSRRACRCCRAATRWAARSTATTTPTARTTRSSWVDWDLDRARRGDARVHARAVRAAARDIPVLRRRSFFRGAPVSGDGTEGRHLARVPTAGDDRRRTGGARDATSSACCVHGDATDEIDDRGRPVPGDYAAAAGERRRRDLHLHAPRDGDVVRADQHRAPRQASPSGGNVRARAARARAARAGAARRRRRPPSRVRWSQAPCSGVVLARLSNAARRPGAHGCFRWLMVRALIAVIVLTVRFTAAEAADAHWLCYAVAKAPRAPATLCWPAGAGDEARPRGTRWRDGRLPGAATRHGPSRS